MAVRFAVPPLRNELTLDPAVPPVPALTVIVYGALVVKVNTAPL